MKGLTIRRKHVRRSKRSSRHRSRRQRGGQSPEISYPNAVKVEPVDPNEIIDGVIPRVGSAFNNHTKIEEAAI